MFVRTLAAGWAVRDFLPGAGLTAGVHLPGYAIDDEWIGIPVPGDVHRALIDVGRIPDPFYDRNETACAWMEEREWWYRLTFEGPDAEPTADTRLDLVLHGLDTFATVYLDGDELGEHHNMFRPAVFDVTQRLVPGVSHTLAIRFDPPLQRIVGKTQSAWGRNPERTPMRKAQFGYGWDWGPRLPTIGIWRPVELQIHSRASLVGVHFSTLDITPSHDRAAVSVGVELAPFAAAGALTARIQLTPPGDAAPVETSLAIDARDSETLSATAYLTVENPRLWWTHELGDASLYGLTVGLYDGETQLDQVSQRVGIRTLVLDQSPDPAERGTRFFRFILNGIPIFAKGADWIPCDPFVGAIPESRYTALLEQARDANMTMLRIWGGGIYEHDHFYAECDRLGMLVWQDFMFACAMYPEDDPDFIAEVEAEARYQVRRLRNHASLALWCGNNENQWLHDRTYWDRKTLPAYGALYYDSILPRSVQELDGRTPYWPGSPYGGNDHNSRDEGNVHNWDVWHGNSPRRFGQQPGRTNTPEAVSYRRYAEDLGRFVSEFGMHAAPQTETLWRVIPREERYQHSPALDWHNKDNPKNKGDNLLLATTGLPTNLEQYILFSQIAQAEGLKFGIEHYRRRKPHCSGTLVWQLDDCWPVLSWSVLDYYGFPKASFFYLKRVYAPVLASFKAEPGGELELWLTNDTEGPITDEVSIRLGTFDGQTRLEETRALGVAAGNSACVWRWSVDDLNATPENYIAVRSGGGVFPANRHFFGDIKDLVRHPAPPEMAVTPLGPRAARVQLRAPSTSYVYFAHLTSPHESTRFSDNFVDLQPGETFEIEASDPERDLDPEALRLGWA